MPINPFISQFNSFNNPGASAYGSFLSAGSNLASNALNAATQREGNQLDRLSNFERALVDQQGNFLNRQSAYERNFLDHDLGLKSNETNRYNIDTGRQNLLSQLASQDKNFALGDATNKFGIQAGYDANAFGSLSNLAGNRYQADRSAQASLGSAALGAQASMLGPMLQQQRFNSLAPHVLGALGSLGKGGSNLSNAIMGGK